MADNKDKKEKLSKKDDSKGNKNPQINDKVDVNFEPSIHDVYAGMDEGFSVLNDQSDTLEEVMSVASRIRRRQQVRRYRSRMQIARKRSLRRRASNSVIGRRARRSAVMSIKKKLAGGRSTNQLTYSERARVEKLVKRRKGLVQRRARKLLITKRQQDRNRLSHRK